MTLAEQLDALPGNDAPPRERLLEALAMYEEGVAMQQLNLRRRYPHLSDDQIDAKLQAWLAREGSSETR